MSRTVLLDPFSTLFIGHLMALAAWRQLPSEEGPFNRYFWRAMGYAVLVWVPVTGYFYYAYPDWSWVYVVDAGRLPAGVGPLVLSLYVAGLFFGFLTAQHLIRERRTAAAAGSMAFALAVVLACFALTHHQYAHLGTREAYLAGRAVPIAQVPSFVWTLNIAGVLLVLGAAGVVVANWLEGRARTH